MNDSYVEKHERGYRVAGSRVSLDSIVYDWLAGLSPESILANFDTLTLAQVYGAIAYYLSHQQEVDEHLQRNRAKFEALREESRARHPQLYQKLAPQAEALAVAAY
jgi:uncharacterized protein (DUF433 family)